MALRGSLITGPDFPFVDDVTYDMIWDTETKFGDGTLDFFDAGTDNESLVIPTSLDGEVYELFLWMENGGYFGSFDDCYLGIRNTAGGVDHGDHYYILRDVGYYSYGFRSGPILMGSTAHKWKATWRTFGSSHGTMDSNKCRFGVLVGAPKPIGWAAMRNSSFPTTGSSTNDPVTGTEDFDDGDVLDHTTGVFTAPTGTQCVVVNCNCNSPVFDGSITYMFLQKNGVTVGWWGHNDSGRAPGPGTFGLVDASPGDTFVVYISDTDGSARTQQVSVSAEFYG